MRKHNIIESYKKGEEYGLKIPAGTTGSEVEVGLATAIIQIANRQKTFDPDFKTNTLVEKIKGWIRCVEQEQ